MNDKDDDDFKTKSELALNYLVRSKKRKTPRNWPKNPVTCLRQLEMLKEVELLQNVQVQKSLKSLMRELNIEKRKSIGQLQSARDFHKEIERKKRHNSVERIRKQQREKYNCLERTSLSNQSVPFSNAKHESQESILTHEPRNYFKT